MNAFRNPLKQARGHGSAHAGVRHFMIQRLTALALVPLVVWMLVLALSLASADYASARTMLAAPLNATATILFLVALFWHAQLGLQVIVEDYVHGHVWQFTLQIAIRFLCLVLAVASILAVLRIALGS